MKEIIFYLNFLGCHASGTVGDGYCDDHVNNAECNYDGGDSCGQANVNTQNCADCICYSQHCEWSTGIHMQMVTAMMKPTMQTATMMEVTVVERVPTQTIVQIVSVMQSLQLIPIVSKHLWFILDCPSSLLLS